MAFAFALEASACSGGRAVNLPADSGTAPGDGATGGVGGSAGMGSTGGFSVGVVPPFSIPPAPAAGSLNPCDSIEVPEALAFLPDGRALVAQRILQLQQRLVRLWTFSTNTVESLFSTQGTFGGIGTSGENLTVSDDGRYLIEILDYVDGLGKGVRVFDLVDRRFLAAEPLEIAAAAVSSDGRFILDRNLQRFTIGGQPDFDFAPLVAAALAPTNGRVETRAMSRTGNAVAVSVRTSLDGTTTGVLVARRDGRLVTLPSGGLSGIGALSFSPDERFLLANDGLALRVWDLDNAAVVSAVDGRVDVAAFTPAGSRLLTASSAGVIERDLDGANPFTWPIDPDRRFALGPGKVLGARGVGLVALTPGSVLAEWRHPRRSWPAAVAVTADASFTIVDDPDAANLPDRFPAQMLARFAANRAGPTATFSSNESQTEWDGQLAFSPGGERLAVVFPDSVRIVDSKTLALMTTLATEAGAIAWSPDGRFLAATPNLHYRDPGRVPYQPPRAVTLWDARSGALAARHSTAVYPRGIAFDETGRTLRGWGSDVTVAPASGGFLIILPSGDPASFTIDLPSGVVSPLSAPPFVASARDLVVEEGGVFRVSTGAALATFGGVIPHRAAVSDDLSLVLVGTKDATAKLYAVGDGHLVAAWPLFVSQGDPLALSRDGRRLAIDTSIYCLHAQ